MPPSGVVGFTAAVGTSLEHLQGLAGRIVVTVAAFIVQGTRDIELFQLREGAPSCAVENDGTFLHPARPNGSGTGENRKQNDDEGHSDMRIT